MSKLIMMRIAAAAGAILGLAALAAFADGFKPAQWAPLALWAAAPLPIGYWLARKLAPAGAAQIVALAGLGLALGFGAWIYWEMIFGQSSRTESLAGLIVLFAPVYQYGVLAIALAVAYGVRSAGGAPGKR